MLKKYGVPQEFEIVGIQQIFVSEETGILLPNVIVDFTRD